MVVRNNEVIIFLLAFFSYSWEEDVVGGNYGKVLGVGFLLLVLGIVGLAFLNFFTFLLKI